MKIFKTALVAMLACAGTMLLASCGGVSDRHDDIKQLNKKSKWDEDQTNQAIDIIIEAYGEQADLMEDAGLIQEKLMLKSFIGYCGDKDVLKERKNEIKDAEKEHDKVLKEVRKKYGEKTSDNDYDYEDDDY